MYSLQNFSFSKVLKGPRDFQKVREADVYNSHVIFFPQRNLLWELGRLVWWFGCLVLPCAYKAENQAETEEKKHSKTCHMK